jgi:hypothetical protein
MSVHPIRSRISETEVTSQEDHLQHFFAFHANLLQLATSYITENSPTQYKENGFGYWFAPMHLTNDEFQELIDSINIHIEKAILNEPTSQRTPRIFAGMFIPQKSKGQSQK